MLLLDEPAAGMNPNEKEELMHLIRRVRDEFGVAVLLIEHDMHIVRQLAQKVTVLHQGQVLAEGPLAEVVENEQEKAVYLGKGHR